LVSLSIAKLLIIAAALKFAMSDVEAPREGVVGAMLPLSHTWHPPVKVRDFAPQCCTAHGVQVRNDQPCFWLDNVLSPEECDALIHAVAEHHDCPLSDDDVCCEPGVRSQFSTHDPQLCNLLWERIRQTVPQELDGGQAVGLKEDVAHCRYFCGQVGFPHMDFRHGQHGDPTIASRISFTVYLDDAYEGGELSFVNELRMDGSTPKLHTTLKPQRGSAVLVYQCVPQFAHLPHEIKRGQKSIMRADVMYRFPDSAGADIGGINVSL
jgi:hypothetical protein